MEPRVGHLGWQKAYAREQSHVYAGVFMSRTTMWSGYLQQLSSVAKLRYKEKVFKTGLKVDPYSISSSEWDKSPELLPAMSWSDVTVYMISTPSPYTGEALKV